MSRGELGVTFLVAVVVPAQVDRDEGRRVGIPPWTKKGPNKASAQNVNQNLQKSSHSPIEMQLCILDDTFLNGVPYLPSFPLPTSHVAV